MSDAADGAAQADEHLGEGRAGGGPRWLRGGRAATLAFCGDLGRHRIAPFEPVMADNLRLSADQKFRPAIALRKPAS